MLTQLERYLRARPSSRSSPASRSSDLGARLQPDRRRPARGARPEAPRPCLAPPPTSRSSRSTTCASSSGRAAGPSTPSTASPSRSTPGETLGHRRRVRLRQERDLPRRSSALLPRAGRVVAGTAHVRGPRPAAAVRPVELRSHPRQGHRDDLPGPDDEPEPGAHDRAADPRGARDAPRPEQAGGASSARSSCSTRSGSRAPKARLKRLPAPVLGRHAPAGDDRDGARLRAEAPDRRRADDGARRDDPGADPRPAARARHRARARR